MPAHVYLPACSQARFQGVPDWMMYCGRDERAKHLQVGNAVPYLLAVEVAASVLKAATGQDGSRPPALVGPSLEGWGLSAADLPRYQEWVKETGGAGCEGRCAVLTGDGLQAEHGVR